MLGGQCQTWLQLYPLELESSSRAMRMMVAPVKISFSAPSVAVGGKLPTNTIFLFLVSERNNCVVMSGSSNKFNGQATVNTSKEPVGPRVE